MKYLFFLIILLVPVGLAQAEVGENFDTKNLGNGLVKWTSHYERVFDGTQWVNYISENTASETIFKSAEISFQFDKVNCDFKLYDPITDNLVINSYQFGIAIDGIAQPISSCNLIDLTQTDDILSFKIDYGEFKTAFDFEPSKGMEWTHEITNNEGKASTFTITETCQDCIAKSIDGNKIDFGSYTLDTKNEEHNTVKDTRSEKGDYVIEFEKTISDKEQLIIDPIFSSNNPTEDGMITDTNNSGTCQPTGATYSKNTGSAQIELGTPAPASTNDCSRGYFQWSISSIPSFATITNTIFKFSVNSVLNPKNCDVYNLEKDVMTASDVVIMEDAGNGTQYIANSATCTVAANNLSFDLGASADAKVQTQIATTDRFGIGMRTTSEVQGGTNEIDYIDTEDSGTATPKPTLEITYSIPADGYVDDLTATDIRYTGVDLSWTTPNTYSYTLQGYQINKTTPWNSNVATKIINSTNSSTTTYSVTGLTGSTQYSFRVGWWATNGDKLFAGNVLNITTDIDPTAEFTPGTLNLTASGIDVRTIKYTRTDINSTSLFLNVTAPNTYQLACNFYYKFAATNKTYTNIANVSINANEDRASFRFNHVDNEIIDVLCWNQYTNQSAKYLITQTHFPFQDQLDNFRNGTYRTQGQFGAFDFITIIGIMVSMMGFNRVNAVVGVIFCAITIGVLSWFQIIHWQTILGTVFAILIFWAWSTHRKDD